MVLFLLLVPISTFAQQNQPKGDVCHVYVVDVAKGKQALEKGDEKLQKEVETIFPTFTTTIGEEETTTQTYLFPGVNNLYIIAQIFYTDESTLGDSMLLTIAVSPKKEPDKFSETTNASAEVTYDENTKGARAKMFIKVKNREYLVGLQCDCNVKKENKKTN